MPSPESRPGGVQTSCNTDAADAYRAGRIIIGLSSMPADAGIVMSHSTCQTGRWACPNACLWLRDHDEGKFVDLAQSLDQILI